MQADQHILVIIIGILLFTMGFLIKRKSGKFNYLYMFFGALILLIGLRIV